MELPEVGGNCRVPSCQQLDFLPFRCPHCNLSYCPVHRHAGAHSCSGDPDRVLATIPLDSGPTEKQQCAMNECNVSERAELMQLCSGCGRRFCLSHRHERDHGCANLGSEEKSKLQKKEAAKEFVESRMGKAGAPSDKSTISSKPGPTPAKPKKLNLQIEIMKMKSKAKGDAGVPQDSRVYLQIRPPRETNKAPEPYFFHKVGSFC